MRILILSLIVFAALVAGCSSTPEKRIITRPELEKTPPVEVESSE
jgi:uncharacterized protein YceK